MATQTQNPVIVQSRVISALVLRETRVAYGEASFGYLWAIAEPVLGTFALVLIFSFISRVPPLGTSFALFFATGIITFQLYRKLSSSLMKVFEVNKGLLAYPLVKDFDVVIARYVLVTLTNVLVIIVFYGVLIAAGSAFFPDRLDQVMSAIFATSLLGLGAGLTNAIIYRLWPTWKTLEGVVSRPLLFLSGVFYIPTRFSSDIQYMLSWNPILHCIEWVRTGYYPEYNSPVLDKSYLFMYILILLAVSFAGERLYRKKRV
ncbi:ABC transporter permease [Roseibium aggregatum]|uniref:ABC transporter permease n=1 Tax=Roseibium aggregatum TaxID=187304 RepID=UPI003A9763B9